MIKHIYFLPTVLVISAWMIYRYAIRKTPISNGMNTLSFLALLAVSIITLPLVVGVWLPDLSGKNHSLGVVTLPDGKSAEFVQYWNFADFYNLDVHITDANGNKKIHTIDGDSSKLWHANLSYDVSQNKIDLQCDATRHYLVTP